MEHGILHQDAVHAASGKRLTGYSDAIRLRHARASAYAEAWRGAWIRREARHQDEDGSIARLGLVRSISVQTGWPEVWQTLGVETHA